MIKELLLNLKSHVKTHTSVVEDFNTDEYQMFMFKKVIFDRKMLVNTNNYIIIFVWF